MKTRYATRTDIPELVRIINNAYRVEDFFVDGDRINADDVTSRMETPDACFLVIDSPDTGSLAAGVWVNVQENRGHFAVLSVDPAFQGKGLARVLIDAVEAHCRKAGCEWLDIEVVNLRLELPPFYAKLGFVPNGTAVFTDIGKLKREAHLDLMTKPLSRGGV
ncbi:MAG: GNAT family N-acetyltransferase [Gemmatimonadaceae bacterium]